MNVEVTDWPTYTDVRNEFLSVYYLLVCFASYTGILCATESRTL